MASMRHSKHEAWQAVVHATPTHAVVHPPSTHISPPCCSACLLPAPPPPDPCGASSGFVLPDACLPRTPLHNTYVGVGSSRGARATCRTAASLLCPCFACLFTSALPDACMPPVPPPQKQLVGARGSLYSVSWSPPPLQVCEAARGCTRHPVLGVLVPGWDAAGRMQQCRGGVHVRPGKRGAHQDAAHACQVIAQACAPVHTHTHAHTRTIPPHSTPKPSLPQPALHPPYTLPPLQPAFLLTPSTPSPPQPDFFSAPPPLPHSAPTLPPYPPLSSP